MDIPYSMVLTENEYIDFVINLNKDEKLLPDIIRDSFVNSSLLLIGYNLEDIGFRITFQGIMNVIKSLNRLTNVVVHPLVTITSTDQKRVKAIQYLDTYAKQIFRLLIYWGDVGAFAEELGSRWDKFTMKDRSIGHKKKGGVWW
jgi:hypothetical protein